MGLIVKICNKIKHILRKDKLVMYSGNYKSWDEARKFSEGYDDDAIFQKVTESALVVKSGKAVYERDSWLYFEKSYNYPLLFHLSNIKEKHLNVLDFGGGTASTYYQNREIILSCISNSLKWIVVEQPHFAKWGRDNLEDTYLKFLSNENDVLSIIQKENINVILLSGVLQYLDFADDLINCLLESGVKKIIIERTPVTSFDDRIVVETVKEPIYNATYSAKFYNESEFIKKFHGYTLQDSWNSLVDEDVIIEKRVVAKFKSFVFEKDAV